MNPPDARILRAKGPVPNQPRATPWVMRCKNHPSPEGATQPRRRHPMNRPYRAQWEWNPKPRALPWAGICRTVGAENLGADSSAMEREIDQQIYALYGLTPEKIAIVERTAP